MSAMVGWLRRVKFDEFLQRARAHLESGLSITFRNSAVSTPLRCEVQLGMVGEVHCMAFPIHLPWRSGSIFISEGRKCINVISTLSMVYYPLCMDYASGTLAEHADGEREDQHLMVDPKGG
jgi:hypothetical protein